MTDVNEQIADLMLKFENTAEFQETWNKFIETKVIDDDFSFKQICSLFFAFGAIDMIKKYTDEKKL